MNYTTGKIKPPVATRTAWYVGTRHTVGGSDYAGMTSPEAFSRGIGGILERAAAQCNGAEEVTVLIGQEGSKIVQLTPLVRGPGATDPHPVTTSAQAAGYHHGRIGPWTTFYAKGRPTIYVGLIDVIVAATATNADAWPFMGTRPGDTVTALQRWHELTGIAWQAGPPVVGIELMHRNLPRYRPLNATTPRALAKPVKRDENSPHGARESMWTIQAWRRSPGLVMKEVTGKTTGTMWLHSYDKVRAGMTAAGVAKLSPAPLVHRGKGSYDPTRAGWWSISAPAWNDPSLPHPCGPDARVWQRLWVTSATMDLLVTLAEEGRVELPEIIESWTGPSRPVLQKWYDVLNSAYHAPTSDRYTDADHTRVRNAIRYVARSTIGMLNNGDSTIYRPDWFHAINGTKRANSWRKMDYIARTEGRYPVLVDDDSLFYASAEADATLAAPETFGFTSGRYDITAAGAYRINQSKEITR